MRFGGSGSRPETRGPFDVACVPRDLVTVVDPSADRRGDLPVRWHGQLGAYVEAFVRLQCSGPQEYTLRVQLFREGVGAGFFEVVYVKSSRSGVDSVPALWNGAGPCESTQPDRSATTVWQQETSTGGASGFGAARSASAARCSKRSCCDHEHAGQAVSVHRAVIRSR